MERSPLENLKAGYRDGLRGLHPRPDADRHYLAGLERGALERNLRTSSRGLALPDFFAHERSVETRELSEALALANSYFRYDRTEIAVAQLSLDAELRLRIGRLGFQLTEKAFDELCSLIGVPVRFAKAIPADLAATIVERLKRLHQQSLIVITRDDDVVVGLVDPLKWTRSRAKTRRPHFRPVTNAEALGVVAQIGGAFDDRAHIVLADSGVRIALVERATTLEPVPGDVTRVGLQVTSSETGGSLPQGRGYALRLACMNGATIPVEFGSLRFNSDWRMSFERRLAAFQEGLREFALDIDLLGTIYERLQGAAVSDQLFYSLYRQAHYIYRLDPAAASRVDVTLGVTAEERAAIIARVRRRQADARRESTAAWGAHLVPAQATHLVAWDLFNAITAMARHARYRQRIALERLGGDLLRVYAPEVWCAEKEDFR